MLRHYENGLSDALEVRHRHIVDKFERAEGIDNIDILELEVQEKYQTIISISTMEHIGQNCAPTGQFGARNLKTDLEAPLKAIARIYDLLAPDGKAFLTVPFGRLIDGGWYIQFSLDYLELLTSKYGIPRDALSIGYLKQVAFERQGSNPRQRWLEVAADDLKNVYYDTLRGGARAIAVLELNKLPQAFGLNLEQPPTSLPYAGSPPIKILFFAAGLLRRGIQRPGR